MTGVDDMTPATLADALAGSGDGLQDLTVRRTVVKQGLAGAAVGFGLGIAFGLGPLASGVLVGGAALAYLHATAPDAEAPVLQFAWIAAVAALGAVGGRATREVATFA